MLRVCTQTIVNCVIRRTLKPHRNFKHKHKCVSVPQCNLTLSCVQPERRGLHTNIPLKGRPYKDAENVYAHSILQSIPIIDKNRFVLRSPNEAVATLDEFNRLLDQEWRTKSATEIVEGFKSALEYSIQNGIVLSDTRFDKLVDGLMDHVQELTDYELSELLECIREYPACESYSSHNFHDIWSALDDVCCWRIPNWSNDTMFLFAEHWYRLNLGKFSDLVYIMIDRMRNRLKHIDKVKLMHLLFYFKINKRHELDFDYQYAIDRHINEMSLDEVTLSAMAFLKNRTKFKLMTTPQAMIGKLKKELPDASGVCIAKIVEVRKLCNYTLRFMEKLSRRAKHLSKTELIHAFFYLNICRKQYVDVNFENALGKYIYDLTVDELAVIAMGFFKSQSPVKLKFLLNYMISQATLETHTIHTITLTSLLKVLRYSSHVLLIDQLIDLLNCITPEINRLSTICCTHIALLGTTLQFFHQNSLKLVTERIIKEITDPEKVRLKDMERLLLALAMFDYDPKTSPDIFQSVFDELHKEQRRPEFVIYKRCVQSTLHSLSMRGIFSYELMNEILDKNFIAEVYGKVPKSIAQNVISLDTCIEVECPDYAGNRLDKTVRSKAMRWYIEYTPSWDQQRKLQAADKYYLDVLDTTATVIGGHDYLQTQHLLPNFVKADIIICRNFKGKFVRPTGFEGYTLGDVMRAPNRNLKWFAVVPVNWNNAIRNTSTPLGHIQMKKRQLKAIGYEPILVIWNEYKDLNTGERAKYILDKINDI